MEREHVRRVFASLLPTTSPLGIHGLYTYGRRSSELCSFHTCAQVKKANLERRVEKVKDRSDTFGWQRFMEVEERVKLAGAVRAATVAREVYYLGAVHYRF
ncbi:hypothetical protein CBR_g11034 [Chara braunii]|uniref:Uncharacterized protein n=1 Tax=Chara braunii TaxID=69332 RepID=A0A388KPW5_CHABU|nr:hypothetical protein CBR_g11034 [Chara braunii]|eukprot:GBG72101.1 hypothetical protein CBR_g11034 [Chara braunii]